MNNITNVEFYWDNQPGVDPGWFARAKDEEGDVFMDSMKAWFPVDLDAFGEDDADDVASALAEAFEDAEVVAL